MLLVTDLYSDGWSHQIILKALDLTESGTVSTYKVFERLLVSYKLAGGRSIDVLAY